MRYTYLELGSSVLTQRFWWKRYVVRLGERSKVKVVFGVHARRNIYVKLQRLQKISLQFVTTHTINMCSRSRAKNDRSANQRLDQMHWTNTAWQTYYRYFNQFPGVWIDNTEKAGPRNRSRLTCNKTHLISKHWHSTTASHCQPPTMSLSRQSMPVASALQ